jgi:hypothetical protein
MPNKSKPKRFSFAVIFVLGLAAYGLFLRKRLLRWGTSASKAKDYFPGDELVPDRDLLVQTTRTVIIQAAPADIWPWLVQIGQGRGGFYSYDWLENLFRMDIHNADRILPAHQSLKVGDTIPFCKDAGVTVRALEPNRLLVLAGSLQPGSDQTGGSWAFFLEPIDNQVTSLIVRTRVAAFSPIWLSELFSLLLLEPGHFVMERKMLRGIQALAEANRSEQLLLDELPTG